MYTNLKPNKHKIISFNTTIMASLGFIVVGIPPLFLLEKRDKPVKGGLI